MISTKLKKKNLKEIAESIESESCKRIIFMEALAVALADGEYDEKERDLIIQLKKAFNISMEDYEQFKEWLKKFNELYLEAYNLVHV